MKKSLFILNPSSGSQNFWKDVEAVIGCLILNEIVNHVDVVFTEKKHDARETAGSLRRGQYDVVVAVGGDGTVSDVINGIIKGKSGIPVAVLSCGTSNVFAQALELPFEKEDFCCMLRDFRIMEIDVGRFNGEYFVSTLAGGMASEISAKAAGSTKAIFGKKAYFFEALRVFPKQFFHSMKLYFDSEEFTAKTETMMFYISNAGGIAGNKRLFKNSTTNDGVLNVAVFEKTSPIKFALDFSRFLRGKNMAHSKVRCFSTKKIKIKSPDGSGIFLACDGDVAGSLPAEVECVPKAVGIVVPSRTL